MKKNLGNADKIIRIMIAAVIGILYFTNILTGNLELVLLLLSIVFVLTSLISFCPLYVPLGINTTCKKKK